MADKVELEFTTDDKSGSPPIFAGVSSVRDSYVSGDSEAKLVDTEDLEDKDRTMMVVIALAKNWRAHANLLLAFVRCPFTREKETQNPTG